MTTIIKLGGSLFTLPDLRTRLLDVIAQRSGENCVIICGGGATADVIRDWSRLHSLDEEAAHSLAIASMDFNIGLLQSLMNWSVVASREEAELHWSTEQSPLLLKSADFIRGEESQRAADPNVALPHNWDVTSDSIAAWTAIRWPAAELLQLKSIQAPSGISAQEASDKQFVDRWFPRLSPHISCISWCNLRSSPLSIERWLTRESP